MNTVAALPDFSPVRLLVVGDVMLDRYYLGKVRRISPEAPVQVIDVAEVMDRPGGAANVAVNARALGTDVTLLSVVGEDDNAQLLEKLLREHHVECRFFVAPGSSTIVKSRVMSCGQQLLRLDFEDRIPPASLAALEQAFDELLPEVDAVVLSDYAKGCLERVEYLVQAARRSEKPVFVDPKRRDFSCYRGASVVTPNFGEFTEVAGVCADEDEIGPRARALMERFDLGAVLVTRGGKGMSLVHTDGVAHIPAESHEVYDVTGAGDTVISVLSCAFCTGMPLIEAAHLANSAAGIAVERSGSAVVSVADLRKRFHGLRASGGVCAEEALLELVAEAKRRGDVIVMTNGCFDILHVGHADYLARAAMLGDRLIVAVNADESVRRIKGEGRPVNGLQERARLLAALEAVDWVVSFREDTPGRLIELVAPDVLVKGGDYRAEEVVGHDSVVSAGGRVVILDYLEGFSTSGLISSIRGDGDR